MVVQKLKEDHASATLVGSGVLSLPFLHCAAKLIPVFIPLITVWITVLLYGR